MQGFKKTLVALLAVAMVLSLVGPVFAAPADVAGTKYEDAAVRLIALGVFKGDDKGNFNPDAPITRAEAAAVIIRALGLEKSADLMKGVTKFTDVNADAGLQWATGAINVAVSNGIVNGYPNGQFGGRDNVTYAQLAKMVLYALNYGVVVEGGVWPTAVLAKADDLDILDGMTVVADAPITRGDAAKMIDNSLDVKSLKQFGYGDIQQYDETGKTLLERMGLDEIEGRVVGIPEVEKGLRDDEISIAVTKENGDKVDKTETYTELAGVDVQGLFGLKVKAWAKDDEIVFVEDDTADNDIYTDTIDSVKNIKDNKVDLVILDDDVEFADKATVYVNYKKAKVADLKVGYYGRMVQDKNEIVFASLFDFGSNEGVVTKVEDARVKYFTYDDTERTLNLSKADSITVFNADLTKADFDDLEKDDVISWWKSDDDYYIVVAKEKVEGKLTKVKSDKVTIDGKAYTIKSDKASFSLGNDEEIDRWTGKADDLDDLYNEEVTALLNLKGHVRHLRGSVEATSGTQYGIVTASSSDSKITVFAKDGEEVTYDLDKRTDWGVLRTPKDGMRYYGDNNSLGYYVLSYKVKADGSIAESDANVGVKYAISISKAQPGASDIKAAELSNSKAVWGNVVKAKKDDSFVTIGSGSDKYYIDSKTVVMRAVSSSKKELDPEVLKWEDFKDLILTNEVANKAVVFGEANKDAKAIIFVDSRFAGTTEDTYYGVVTDKPWKADGDWYAEIDVFEKGIVEYKLASSTLPAKGNLVEFTLNAKGEADVTVVSPPAKEVKKVDGNYIDLGSSDWYKVESDAVVYDWNNDDNKLGDKLVRSDIDEKDTIQFVADGKVIKAAIINKDTTPGGSGDPLVEGVVTYITANNIAIDNVVYTFDANSVLYNTAGTVVATGGSNIIVLLAQNDIVEDVEIVNGNVKSLKLKVDASAAAATVLAMPLTTAAEVEAARTAYDALPASVKLEADAITAVGNIETQEAAAVDTMITTIGTLSTPATAAEIKAVEDARAAYEALTAGAKAKVTPANLVTLAGYEDTIATEEVTGAVETLIAAIPAPASLTLADESKVTDARAAYNALTTAQKAIVDAAAPDVNTIVAAEAQIAALKEVAAAKAALTTLTFDAINNAAHAEPNILKPAAHANGATYTLALGTIPAGETVTGTDPVVIERGAAEFTFEITVTIDDANTKAQDTVVFTVTVPVTGNVTVAVK